MIEEMAEKAGGPVVLIAHSMGNMYTLYFLNHQPQAWKDRYIKSFVALGAPWGGVVKTMRVVTSGETENTGRDFMFSQRTICLVWYIQRLYKNT
jgi:triacylglycerol esterase/lipase EstA (alpha/beta hydrolase family)